MRLLLFMLLLQAAPAQTEADKTEAALKKFGDRTYRVMEGSKATGTMTLKTRIERIGDQKVAIFEDRLERKVGDALEAVTITETSKLDGLGLIRGESATSSPAGDVEASVSVRDGDAYTSGPDGMLMLLNVEGFMGILAPARVLSMKTQEVGATFKANVVLWTTPSGNSSHEFRCVSKESLEVDGKKIDAFKWEVKWKGKLIKGADRSIKKEYWIGADGTLLQFRTESALMVLDAK